MPGSSKEELIGKIPCPTRGGEASYRTQDLAIELARERDEMLLLLYVVDLGLLDKMAEASVLSTEQELARVGRGLLLLATARALDQGVAVETIIRTGEMREEVKNTARMEDVSLVVLGQPAGGESVYDTNDLEAIASRLRTR
ncbi:MAG: universal stress protein [Anaerolineae bacterium]